MDFRNIEYITYFDYASLVVMLVLIISYYMMKHLDNVQNRILKVMLYTHFIVVITDIINVLGPQMGLQWIHEILYGSHLFYFLFHTATIFAFFFYCCCLADQYGYGKPWLQFLVCLPMILSFVLLVFIKHLHSPDTGRIYLQRTFILKKTVIFSYHFLLRQCIFHIGHQAPVY